jgi:hypothetical protein
MGVNEKMTAIADAIRSKTGGTEPLGLDEMAVGVGEVFDAGKQAEYDRFWDGVQDNGNRTDYRYAFKEWRSTEINPKYPIVCTANSGTEMFNGCQSLILPPTVTPVNGSFETIYCMFQNCRKAQEIGWDIKVVSSTSSAVTNTFNMCHELVNIKSLTFDVAETISFSANFFGYCYKLENVQFGGTIRNNGLNMQYCTKLSKASIESLINVLSTTTTGKSVTLSKTAVNNAFTDTEWATLANTRSNWTINLV